MKIPLFQIDAFVDGPFSGNPAAVCPLEQWLADDLMQAIAAENNLSETAFVVPHGAQPWALRWFTPTTEVDLCGHATAATAYVLFNETGAASPEQPLRFDTRSGTLSAAASGSSSITLDFPARELRPLGETRELARRLKLEIVDAVSAIDDWIICLPDEHAVRGYVPDQREIAQLDARGLIITARGAETDFVSRFFGPRVGVDEDPVTGSAHCSLTPFWAARLGRRQLVARQLSARGGTIRCALRDDRVDLTGNCRAFLRGEIEIS